MGGSYCTIYLFLGTLLTVEAKFNQYHNHTSIRNRIGDTREADLWFVGMYIAAHKYFGADARYMVGETIEKEDRVFYKKFPTPRLREMDPALTKRCEESADMCIYTIYQAARWSGTMKYVFRTAVYPNYPFPNYYELFRFRQTAAYYMCWFTQQRRKDLMYRNDKVTCLEYLHTANDVPKKIREQHIKDWTKVIVDGRDNAEHIRTHPFACAELWFCPDPCYGRKTRGNASNAVTKPKSEPGNPCRYLRNGWCEWKEGANNNFRDLVRNRFNQSCDCASKQRGFEWRPEYGICVDIDECFIGNYSCAGSSVCRNGMGTYICTCRRGYLYVWATQTCKRGDLLHRRATLLKYHPDMDRVEQETDFIDDISQWLGLSRAPRLRMSIWAFWVVVGAAVCVCIRM